MKMLEEWEKKSTLLLLEGTRPVSASDDTLDLDEPIARPEKEKQRSSGSDDYENLFE